MAKISDRQRANIIAKWNTGQYSKVLLAKTYKVTEKVIRNIVGKSKPTNAHFVEAGVLLEKVKNSEKSTLEVKEINKAVKYRLEKEYNEDNNRVKIYDLTADILSGVSKLISGGKAQKVTTANMGDGIVEANIIETDLQARDYESAMNTVDKASITMRVNNRHAPKIDISNLNAQQDNSDKQTVVKIVLDDKNA